MRTFLSLSILFALALPAQAGHCATWTTSAADATLDASAAEQGTYYVVGVCAIVAFVTNHLVCGGDGATWIYEETNGLPGLQRSDEIADDTCHGLIAGDSIVF